MNISKALKKFREQNNFGQEPVYKALGLTQQHYSNIERGLKKNFDLDLLDKIQKMLNGETELQENGVKIKPKPLLDESNPPYTQKKPQSQGHYSRIGNENNDLSLVENERFSRYFKPILPGIDNSNFWFTYIENTLDLKEAIYSGEIKDKNMMLMKSKPENLLRIPDILSDFSFEMFSKNMSPRYNPGDRLTASFVDMEDVMFGYAYYIVFHNRRLPATVNYIRKTKDSNIWLLANEDKMNFDDKEVNIEKIHSIYTITYAGRKNTQ